MIAILKFWKEILLVCLTVVVLFLNQDIKSKVLQIEAKDEKISKLSENLIIANKKVEIFEAARNLADIKFKESEKQRAEIIRKMNNEINILRLQTPPEQCEKVIEWAVDRKIDLSWPKN